MNLPNAITLSRLVLTAVCFALMEWGFAIGGSGAHVVLWWAFGLFVFAAATDYVDGWLARKLGQVTKFGRVVDPFVDKVLVCGVLIELLQFDAVRVVLPYWVVVLIVAREFLVTAVRGLVESEGIPFPADRLGKWKMVAQSVTAGALLTLIAGTGFWSGVARVGVWVSLALTLVSALNYCWVARRLLSGPAGTGV